MVAGISTAYIADRLPGSSPAVVRIMPNTPIMLGAGATGICANSHTTPAQLQFVKSLLVGASIVCDIPESQMNPSINLNGSSPAYLFLFAKAAVDYAKSEGIDEKIALELFANTMIGSAKMLTESGMDPQTLINMVTSPGGTTLAALRVFEDCGFEKIIAQAMSACTKRAQELGK
jgi:pyrroline-5-carboxylate reductase